MGFLCVIVSKVERMNLTTSFVKREEEKQGGEKRKRKRKRKRNEAEKEKEKEEKKEERKKRRDKPEIIQVIWQPKNFQPLAASLAASCLWAGPILHLFGSKQNA